ncbi:MAG: hydratase, partial [Clostridia bacterium]|nr:hydratase [Clostridia bacterium]
RKTAILPSNGYRLIDVIENAADIFNSVEADCKKLFGGKVSLKLKDKIKKDGVYVEQGIIAGCAGGTYDNICEAAAILKDNNTGKGAFNISVYPSSQPINLELTKNGRLADMIRAGVNIKSCFCGPCFGAGDVPANGELSIRHTTRNFESREGSKPTDGQIASVALMDARSIAATAINGGKLTCATDIDYNNAVPEYHFDTAIYNNKVYNGWGSPKPENGLIYGPNITEWPSINALTDNILLKMVAVINDPVTTTDELIPSGETSSYRSNPLKLAEFTLSRKVPEYVGRAKAVQKAENQRQQGVISEEYAAALATLNVSSEGISFGSAIFANKPGDGSAREQAASCQRVLGGSANFAKEYATKRYRSNLINWGILPFHTEFEFETGDFVFVPSVKDKIAKGEANYSLIIARNGVKLMAEATILPLTQEEKEIILTGCLMNYYGARK